MNTEETFKKELQIRSLKTICDNCSLPFSKDNTFTPEGWTNTQLYGFCEHCHEDLLANMFGDD
jgi:hypothetical protein